MLFIGNFDANNVNQNGQVARVRSIWYLLKSIAKMSSYDTSNPLLHINKPFLNHERVFIVAPYRSGFIFLLLFYILGRLHRVVYIPTGGWIEQKVSNRIYKFLLKRLRQLYVQAFALKISLEKNGINSVHLPNFRLEYFQYKERTFNPKNKLKTVYNSRITVSKGIFDLIHVIKDFEETVELDVWGLIDSDCKENFEKLVSNTSNVTYRGMYQMSQAPAILLEYDLSFFPSTYQGEGQPGSVLDAVLSGLPIIATDWRFNSELVKHGLNGLLINVTDVRTGLEQSLIQVMKNDTLARLSRGTKKIRSEHCITEIENELKKHCPSR